MYKEHTVQCSFNQIMFPQYLIYVANLCHIFKAYLASEEIVLATEYVRSFSIST